MGVVQLLVQYFLWSHYCISPAIHTWGQTLPCSWLEKWKETEDTWGREMSLCSFVWHRSAGQPFCCITVMRKEDGNWVCSWPCHRLWGPISWRPGNSWIHPSLEEVAKVPFTARSMWAIFSCNQGTEILFVAPRATRERLAGCTAVFTASLTVQLPSLPVSSPEKKFDCLLELWTELVQRLIV